MEFIDNRGLKWGTDTGKFLLIFNDAYFLCNVAVFEEQDGPKHFFHGKNMWLIHKDLSRMMRLSIKKEKVLNRYFSQGTAKEYFSIQNHNVYYFAKRTLVDHVNRIECDDN